MSSASHSIIVLIKVARSEGARSIVRGMEAT